jgi:histone H3/H4
MADQEVLVVVSKLKSYIKEKSGMNTSGGAAAVISDAVRRMCDEAIERARSDGRKTVMDRDFS